MRVLLDECIPRKLKHSLLDHECHTVPEAGLAGRKNGFLLDLAEKAGFEIHSAENVSIHYALTIKIWHENWQKNREAVLKAYGERWYRLWHLFLAWSWRIAQQGTGQCFQVVAHKNLDSFDRRVFIGRSSLGSVRVPEKNGIDHATIHSHNGTTHAG